MESQLHSSKACAFLVDSHQISRNSMSWGCAPLFQNEPITDIITVLLHRIEVIRLILDFFRKRVPCCRKLIGTRSWFYFSFTEFDWTATSNCTV